MNRLVLRGFFLALAAVSVTLSLPETHAAAGTATPRVLVAAFDNDVNPVTQGYLEDVLRRGAQDGYDAVVVEIDTPGGLSTSMRGIVKSILAAPIPVIVYVSPPGSSADSAGAVIGQAADVLAMAPQTNIGSSTPISTNGEDISKDLRRKVVNDAAAYIGELAREHGRNAVAAEAMVRDAANFGAREALRKNVVDDVAGSLPELLDAIDGRVVEPKGLTLATAGATIERTEMSTWKKGLDLLIDPNIIALMLSLGLVGILVELYHPGLVFPGTVGAISLVVALYGLQVLPVSVAGVLLILLALAFFVAELFVPTHAALATAGGVMFVIGSLMLFDPAGPYYQVSSWLAVGIGAGLTLLFGVAVTRVVRARRLPVESGTASLAGARAVVRRNGYVTVEGELWRAHSADGEPLVPGATVLVEEVGPDLALVVGSPHPTQEA